MASKLSGIELTRYDDLFKTDAEREADRQERIQIVPAAEVFPYSRQPYTIDRPTPDLVRLMDSIEHIGIAEPLIVRALEIPPDHPFILDSLGWVRFRRGDGAAALVHLERAYAKRQDAEIAAHLGEVLWSLSRRDDARRILDQALAAHPEDTLLVDTARRLGIR